MSAFVLAVELPACIDFFFSVNLGSIPAITLSFYLLFAASTQLNHLQDSIHLFNVSQAGLLFGLFCLLPDFPSFFFHTVSYLPKCLLNLLFLCFYLDDLRNCNFIKFCLN